MKLTLIGHEDLYAVEQLQLALFPDEVMEPVSAPFEGDGAVSTLLRGSHWITAITTIAGNKTATAVATVTAISAIIGFNILFLVSITTVATVAAISATSMS